MVSSRVTLSDVASAAGVSPSTASRALSGQAQEYRISQATVDAISSAASALGFRPSRVAQSLRLQRSELIGVVVPDIGNAFFSAIAREITLAAELGGFSVLLADSQEDTSREMKLVEELAARQVEAIVACPVGVTSEHFASARDSGLPLVLVDRTFPDSNFVQVTSKHEEGARKAAQLLLRQGHRQIGILQGLEGTLPNEARIAGAKKAMLSAGLTLNTRMIQGSSFTEQSGIESATTLLTDYPRITALLAFSMPNAIGGLRVAREMGREVPDDLSIVAFDDSPFADLMSVPISTVAQDVRTLGKKAAALVMEKVRGQKKQRKKLHQIDIELRDRGSIQIVFANTDWLQFDVCAGS